MTVMLDPVVLTLLAGAFALLLGSAALHKARDLAVFGELLRAYRVLPAGLALPWLVPLLELALAALLLPPATRAASALAGCALLVLYALAIALNLARGRRALACGCGGANERRPIAPWMVWRNSLIALVLVGALAPWGARPLGFTDAVTVVFGLLTVALIYLCIDQLMGNVQRAAHLRGSR